MQVLDLLLKFNNLILFFVEDAGVVQDTAGLSFLHAVVYPSLQEAVDLVFEEEDPAFEEFSSVALDDDGFLLAAGEELLLELKESTSDA